MRSNPRIPYQMPSERRPLAPLNGKPLMVNLAMNVEVWPFDRPMPRGILPAPHGAASSSPDVPNFSWVEYGMRCGMPRFMAMLAARDLPCSALTNAQVADVYPSLMEAMVDAGYELVGHGWFQQSLKQADDEVDVIRRSVERLTEAGGKPPRAWLGPGLGESDRTPENLKAHGIDFLHDWVVDDLPVWIRTEHGPMVGLPYALELNDVPMYAIQHNASDAMLERMKATLSIYEREIAETGQPRVLTLALHPHIIGVPHVAYHFEKALDILCARDDTVFVTSTTLGEWFIEADGTGGAAVAS
jgi:peptidoglycan/xylan/chitin deacetylase (PgdA/CDA1 family)